jgi:DNA-directed RNA polymerase subunit RPC12/RpoP
MLFKVDGPACPDCGCRDSEVISRAHRQDDVTSYFGCQGGAQRRQCRYCGREFHGATTDEPQAYAVNRCPKCRSSEVIVVRTVRPVRYHKCVACNHRFKTHEESNEQQEE